MKLEHINLILDWKKLIVLKKRIREKTKKSYPVKIALYIMFANIYFLYSTHSFYCHI